MRGLTSCYLVYLVERNSRFATERLTLARISGVELSAVGTLLGMYLPTLSTTA